MTDLTVRASSLTEFSDCERRWASRHLAGLVADAGFQLRQVRAQIGAIVGTAVHAGAANILRAKMKTGEMSPPAESVQAGIEQLRTDVALGTSWDDTTRTINEAEQQTARMIVIYGTCSAPNIKPIAVEEKLEARFSPTLRISGTMDIAEDMGVDDNKTGVAQRPHHPQYGAYSLLRRSVGATVSRFREHWIPRQPVKQPQRQPITTEYPVETCEQAAHAVMARVDAAAKVFAKTGNAWIYLPNPASMLCGDRFCPAHSTGFCNAHKR